MLTSLPLPQIDGQTFLLLVGAVVMFLSLIKTTLLERYVPLFSTKPENQQTHDNALKVLQGALNLAALVGYTAAMHTFAPDQLYADVLFASGMWGVGNLSYKIVTSLRSPNPPPVSSGVPTSITTVHATYPPAGVAAPSHIDAPANASV